MTPFKAEVLFTHPSGNWALSVQRTEGDRIYGISVPLYNEEELEIVWQAILEAKIRIAQQHLEGAVL